MQSAAFSISAAASTSAGFRASFAPFTTRMRFCPLDSTKIGATPLDNPSTAFTWVVLMPCFLKFSIVAGPNRSLPTRATMNTSAPQRRAATAWFAPLPPNPRSNLWPKIVSPGFGNRSANVVRSMLALPTTATRDRRDMDSENSATAESIWRPCLCQRNSDLDKYSDRRNRCAPPTSASLGLLTVRNPNVLDLSGMFEEPSALALLPVKPVDDAAFVGEYLFQISYGKRLCCRCTGFVRKTPDGVDVVVLGQRLEQLRGVTGDDIDGAIRQITCVEDLVEISNDERVRFRRNHDRSIARGQNR